MNHHHDRYVDILSRVMRRWRTAKDGAVSGAGRGGGLYVGARGKCRVMDDAMA